MDICGYEITQKQRFFFIAGPCVIETRDTTLKTAEKLKDIALRAYHCVDCRDFGRVDFRVDEQGNPFVLEINPLPCLARKDTFSFVAQALKKTYEEMILCVLDEGLKRLNMSSQKVEVGA